MRKLRIEADIGDAIRHLHPEPRRRIQAALDQIRDDPAAGRELADELAGFRRLRVGRLRIVYREQGEAIDVVAVGLRETIYEDVIRRLGMRRPRAGTRAARWRPPPGPQPQAGVG